VPTEQQEQSLRQLFQCIVWEHNSKSVAC